MRRTAAVVALALAATGCSTSRTTTATFPAKAIPDVVTAPSPSKPTAAAARRETSSAVPRRAPVAQRSSLLVERVRGLGSATQAIVVTSSSWRTDVASLEAFEKDAGSWRAAFGPVGAFVGVNGFASSKREGDGRTPAGVYPFGTMFGASPNPGVRFTYRRATPDDVWVDDPASALYNTWQVAPSKGRWSSAERLYQTGPYKYAVVIAYNTSRVPGKGSAIFMHVSLGHGTAGCVAVDEATLVRMLVWLDPARGPVIAMGPSSSLLGRRFRSR